jgi:hypothetical protein
MNLFIFILICYGACNNLIFGSLFEGYRKFLSKFGTGGYSLYKLFTCCMCLSTWMGFVMSAILIAFNSQPPLVTNNLYLTIFLNGLLSAGGVWLLHTIQETFERIGKE